MTIKKWKFSPGDVIIWPGDNDWKDFYARIVNQDITLRTYRLIWLDSSYGWVRKTHVEKNYKKIDVDPEFFDLFIKR